MVVKGQESWSNFIMQSDPMRFMSASPAFASRLLVPEFFNRTKW